jgi:hypothetical protein
MKADVHRRGKQRGKLPRVARANASRTLRRPSTCGSCAGQIRLSTRAAVWASFSSSSAR